MLNKKMLVVGILLMLLSAIIGGTAYTSAFNGAATTDHEGLALHPSSSIYVSLNVNSSESPLLLYYSSAPVDFYLLNSTAFNSIEPYLSNSSRISALAGIMEGKGVMEVFSNSTLGVFPYTKNYSTISFPPPSYTINGTIPAANATYYIIYSNKGTEYANISYTAIYLPRVSSDAYVKSAFAWQSVASGLLFLTGVIISILSFILGNKKAGEKERDTEAEKIYRKMARRKSRVRGRRRAVRHAKKRV